MEIFANFFHRNHFANFSNFENNVKYVYKTEKGSYFSKMSLESKESTAPPEASLKGFLDI